MELKTSGETMQSLNNASRRCAHVSAIFSPPGFALPKWGAGREAIVFTTRYVMQWGAKEGQTVGIFIRCDFENVGRFSGRTIPVSIIALRGITEYSPFPAHHFSFFC